MGRRRATDSLVELSIHGDEQEQHRINLEHNLQNTALDIHLSDASDVEYPRHIDRNSSIADQFHPSSLDFGQQQDDYDAPSLAHRWSYRTLDDDPNNTVHAYGGETLSTAAHHASAVTLGAGLHGRSGRRGDISLSGAEYDPERPLHGMISGVDTRFSALDDTTSRKYPNASAISFDPLIVDDTEELDRVLASGHAIIATPPSLARLRSPHSAQKINPNIPSPLSSGASSSSSSSGRGSPRPKLSDALNPLSFSPKRPRSAQGLYSPRMDARGASSLRHEATAAHEHARPRRTRARSPSPPAALDPDPTPRPKEKTRRPQAQASPGPSRRPAQAQPQPTFQVQPATPTGGSTFAKMARGLARDIHSAQAENEPVLRDVANEAERAPRMRGGRTHERTRLHMPEADVSRNKSRGAVHLPDVTGLTSAVGTPAKPGNAYKPYPRDGQAEEQVRLMETLNGVQTKLEQLEADNGVSRRRVAELEHELERAKGEVVKERTRVIERERTMQREREVHEMEEREWGIRKEQERERVRKGKQVRMAPDEDALGDAKYREVVEQKKALEVLTSTLRTHLARLTSELTAHQQLLSEFRRVQEEGMRDNRAIKAKLGDVERLRAEVERLSGEVEVLRSVIEEGLRERREHRGEDSEAASEEEEVYATDEDEHAAQHADMTTMEDPNTTAMHHPRATVQMESESEAESDGSQMSLASPSPSRSIQLPGAADKTARTDRATMDSTSNPLVSTSRPYIGEDELARIAGEVSERRSELFTRSSSSVASSRTGSVRAASPVSSVSSRVSARRRARVVEADHTRPMSPVARPAAPTPAHAARRATVDDAREPEIRGDGAHFPEIRGSRMERLFMSAPEHDKKRCTNCNGKRRPHVHADDGATPVWLRSRRWGRERGMYGEEEEEEALPPQTVLAKVLREIEDDFTHYKGIYVELAEQYAVMDAASNVAKRNLLAEHLREVIDVLEQKGDQIASLYDLLRFQDKPVAEAAAAPHYARPGGLRKHPTVA